MTAEEWNNATDEEKLAEMEKCKDPVYMYNNYYIVNGLKPKPITREAYVNTMARFKLLGFKWRGRPSKEYIETVKQQIREELGYDD